MTALTFAFGCSIAAYGCYRLDDAAGDPFRRTAAFRAIDGWIDRTTARIRARFNRKGARHG